MFRARSWLAAALVGIVALAVISPAWAESQGSAAAAAAASAVASSSSRGDDAGLCATPVVGALCAVADPIGTATRAVSGLPGAMAQGASESMARWIASGAAGFLEQAGKAIFSGTEVNLDDSGEGGRRWFVEKYQLMAMVGLVLFTPMLMLAVLQAVFSQSLALLGRAVMNLPIAALGTAVAVTVVGLLLGATDQASAYIAGGLGADSANFLTGVIAALADPLLLAGPSGAGMFGVALLAVFMAFAAFVVWLELLVRQAALYLTVLFLPVALATYIWPALSAWLRRLVEVIVALILSKLVIVAALSLAGSALAAQEGFAALVAGSGMLLLAAFSPFALFKLIPIASMASIGSLEGQGRRSVRAAVPRASTAFYLRQLGSGGSRSRGPGSAGQSRPGGESAPPPPTLGPAGGGSAGGRPPVGSGGSPAGAGGTGALGAAGGAAAAVGVATKASQAATKSARGISNGLTSTPGGDAQ